MAEVDVVYILQKLVNLLHEEEHLFRGLQDHVKIILKQMQRLMMFLNDVVQSNKADIRVRLWLQDVRDVARCIEDLLEAFIFQVSPLATKPVPTSTTRRTDFMGDLIAKLRIAMADCRGLRMEIQQIKIKIDNIDHHKRRYYGIHDIDLGSMTWTRRTSSLRERSSTLSASPLSVVGFDSDARTLLAFLNDPDPRLQVISIVGMAGSGKTTLAKKVYNSTKRNRLVIDFDNSANYNIHFEWHLWINACQGCEPFQILEDIATQMLGKKKPEKRTSVEDLTEDISEWLSNKRYLMVIDDVWDIAVWVTLRAALPAESVNGSRIIVTTRDREVASFLKNCSSSHTNRHHKLQLLDENKSWELFRNNAFPRGHDHDCPTELKNLGKQILKSCGGLPLAIEEIGNFLCRRKKTQSVWSATVETLHSRPFSLLKQSSQQLALSYHNLPCNLKWCFLYCTVFPPESEIHSGQLIRMWFAEGFLHPRLGTLTPEEIGQDYLDRLINKNLIQATRKGPNGRITRCCLHPLMRNMAISEARQLDFVSLYTENDFEFPIKCRRLAIHSNSTGKYIPLVVHSATHIRTLVCLNQDQTGYLLPIKQLEFVCGGLKLLRVLDLESVQMSELLDVIGTLVHLRYLGLKRAGLRKLPSTICRLHNLQTMDLRYNSLGRLPIEMGNLQNLWSLDVRHNLITIIPNSICTITGLRHLSMDDDVQCGHLQFHTIRNLESLSVARVGNWIENGFINLTNLKRLGIYGGFYVDFEEQLWDTILNLGSLYSLKLEGFGSITLPKNSHQHLCKLHLSGRLRKLPNLHGFLTATNITQLLLSWSKLKQDPMATLEKMPKLKILKLKMLAYVGKRMVCSASGFLRLRHLELKHLMRLRDWKIEKGSMPRLERLSIGWCLKLKMIPEGLQYMNSLRELEVFWMLPRFRERLVRDDGEDWFKIRHVNSVVVEGTPNNPSQI
ncbi:putative disease resistance protein At1g50180 [Macadamia integrifolia]|uniref:putative disease resistance protein At1g50180 n=1 Tax=Macadamia integrifolia TaxID=60698 RepID=UPI001C529315|nr:putative disease resistance protein At1g50180 [Macadamia integrifolia]